MRTKRSIERELSALADFERPRVDREQYSTPADLAAHTIHLATLNGDVEGRTIIDLGTGTGMLAIGAALARPDRVVGLDVDATALETARRNEERVSVPLEVEWIVGDAERAPLCPNPQDVTVVMNPPFGAQTGHEHADRAFLATARDISSVSYSFHNRGSESFVRSYASDNGGAVTHAFRVEFSLPRQFEFHQRERTSIDVELFRIEWTH